MQLKPQQEIDAAIRKLPEKAAEGSGTVTQQRGREIAGSVRAARPESMDELDAIFSEHLSETEKAFYRDIVTGSSLQEEQAAAETHDDLAGNAQ